MEFVDDNLGRTKRRLRVVSNFGDGDCGAGEIHTRARESSRRRNAKGAPKIFGAPFASRLLELSRARVYFASPTIAIAKIRDYSQSLQNAFTIRLTDTTLEALNLSDLKGGDYHIVAMGSS